MVMLSMRDCLTSCRSWGESLPQCPVIFLRRSTAASCRTLGVLAVRRWCTSAGTTCGSLASRFIWSSACRRASLSGIKNWISNNSRDCAIALLLVCEREKRVMNRAYGVKAKPYREREWGFCFIYRGRDRRRVFFCVVGTGISLGKGFNGAEKSVDARSPCVNNLWSLFLKL